MKAVVKHRRWCRTPGGFTLIELLAVIGVIGILLGLLLPAVQSAEESCAAHKCANNLKQLILAAHSFASAQGGFPPATLWGYPSVQGQNDGGPFSLQVAILPYLDRGDLYNSINLELPSGSLTLLQTYNYTAASQVIGTFLCPSDSFATRSSPFPVNSYRACIGLGEQTVVGNVGVPTRNGTFWGNSPISLAEIQDGLSTTLAFSEKPVGSGVVGRYDPFRDWVEYRGSGSYFSASNWLNACSHLSVADLTRPVGWRRNLDDPWRDIYTFLRLGAAQLACPRLRDGRSQQWLGMFAAKFPSRGRECRDGGWIDTLVRGGCADGDLVGLGRHDPAERSWSPPNDGP